MTKLLIIGFDGMDYFMAKRTIGEYSFQNFQPILKKQLTKETYTGPSWASFYTGLRKEIHGVTDGWGRDIGESNTFKDIKDHAFWNIISKAGYPIYVDNLPITPDGFPYTKSKEKDIVNWIYDPLEQGSVKWRKAIQSMDYKKVLLEVKSGSLKLIEEQTFSNQDLVFIQFSFLDRLGHVYTLKDDDLMRKSYQLAYELADRLYELIQPQYLMIVSDHGFWKRNGHLYASCGVAILNDKSHQFFEQNEVFKRFSIQSKFIVNCLNLKKLRLNYRILRAIIMSLSFREIFEYLFPCNFIKQTDIFGEVLKIFDIDYEKTSERIEKKMMDQIIDDENKIIEEKLKRLGYM